MREWLKVGFILTLVFGGYIFADVKMSEKYPNVPASWEEECIPEACKDTNWGLCKYSPCHKINQHYQVVIGKKDQNVWVVTPQFAKKFGMEDELISNELKGVEAIAYRKQVIFRDCGYGADDEQCQDNYDGILDVYIDEKKTPLPWINPNTTADIHTIANSTFYINSNTPTLGRPEYYIRPKIGDNDPEKLKGKYGLIHNVQNDAYKLRPFADPLTKHEAAYFISFDEPDEFRIINGVYGYKRDAIEGLTVISFFYYNDVGNSERRADGRTVKLISDFTGIFGIKLPNNKSFHTFYIPSSFMKKIIAVDEAQKVKDHQFYKQTLKKMGYEQKEQENDEGFFKRLLNKFNQQK